MQRCNHNNCLTCPYDDCIAHNGPQTEVRTTKPGPKPMDPALKKLHQQASAKRCYEAHKLQRLAGMKDYYAENRDQILQNEARYRQKTYTEPEKRISGTIWVTDGVKNARIKPEKYAEYLANGWIYGRTLQPYKYKGGSLEDGNQDIGN